MIEQRIATFMNAFTAWIQAQDGDIQGSVERSAERFDRADIMHMLQHLRTRVTADSLQQWADQSYVESPPSDVLCLHAGNLPLVGFQDVAAVWLSGHHYRGKLSRKDPWLMASFLEVLSKYDDQQRLTWSTELSELPKTAATHILFAGSDQTIPTVKKHLLETGQADSTSKWHIRTASFSITVLRQADTQDYRDLAESILRYDGAGCRSVKVVISDEALTSDSCGLSDVMEEWWSKQPTYRKPSAQTRFDVAVLHAVERPYLLLEHLLFESDGELGVNPDRIIWLHGGQERVESLIARYGAKIQSVYGSKHVKQKEIAGRKVEELSRSQDPNIDWKPDGVDILRQLGKL